MTPNSIPTILALFLGITTFILIMLLPAILELKRPRDPGPRRIEDFGTTRFPSNEVNIPLMDIEDEKFKLDHKILGVITEIIVVLPNIEYRE